MKRRFGMGPWVFILILLCLLDSAYAQKRDPDILFVPTPQGVVESMLEMAGVNESDVVYDLGCGDGRFVITAAKKFGARGVGVDIDPDRIKESVRNAARQGVLNRVGFIEEDLYETDIRQATVITLYLLSELNLKLRPKLLSELRPGSRVISYTFNMGDWKPDKEGDDGGDIFYYWVIPAQVAGTWQWSLGATEAKQQFQLELAQKFQEMNGRVLIEGKEANFLEPKLEGDRVRFEVTSQFQGQSVSMRFNGRVSGDTIAGHVDIQGGSLKGTHAWNATRLRPVGTGRELIIRP